ncbi:uncharacterized protein LOC135924217 [Gordionus sp. m RMFG-2023]|uniref:uncharacterized protein LOC135924217 n=1 Tax=Gordionus sp. m RMFG-2023 TaxID=3053472 RepID=UPI0031FD2F45
MLRFGALTNNRSIVLSDSIESTKYKNEHYSKMNSSHGSTYKYTGKITLSDIRIPLLWTEKEHFKSVKIKAKISDSDNGSSWCLFALAIFKNQILESSLITGINAAFTDVTFEKDIFTFYDMPPDFVIKLEFYCSSSRFIFKSKILDQFKTRIPTAKNLVSKYSLNGLTNSKSTSNFVSYWPTMRFKADLSTITSPSKNMGNAMATFKKINLGNFLSHNFLPPYPNGKINKGRGNMSSSCSVDFVQPSNRLNLIASDKYGDNYSNKISKQSFPNSTQESIYSAISNLDDINPVKYILIADCELTSDLVNSSFQVGDLHVKINDSAADNYNCQNKNESQQNRLDIVFKQNYVQLCEIDFYLSKPRSKSDTDPLMWWKTNAHRIPILSKMARDYLSIQGTSTACERLFSVGTNLLSKNRMSYKEENIRKTLCLKNWLKIIN